MGKLNLKAGEKLDLTARMGEEEIELKSSFVKENGGALQLTMPMVGGKSFPLDKETAVVLCWTVDNIRNTLPGKVSGTVKQGIRTNLLVEPTGEIHSAERRAFVRVEAEIDVEILTGETGPKGKRVMQTHPGRTSDISNGGTAVYTDAAMAVGETVDIVLIEKNKRTPLRGAVCWTRPAPRTAGYRNAAGIQFFFLNSDEAMRVAKLTAALAAKA